MLLIEECIGVGWVGCAFSICSPLVPRAQLKVTVQVFDYEDGKASEVPAPSGALDKYPIACELASCALVCFNANVLFFHIPEI